MSTIAPDALEHAASLRGQAGWLITDGKIGMDVQVRGVADALGLASEMKHVNPTGIHKLLSPWLPPAPRERIGAGGAISPPWPAIVIATGRQSIPYLRKVRRLTNGQTYSVILQDPKTGGRSADLIWVPSHDRLRGPNVITTPTAPHSFTQARLASMRANVPPDIAALPHPRVAVMLGGATSEYPYSDACHRRLADALQSLARLGASFMITPSRRTHKELIAVVDAATTSAPRILWTGTGPNPYADFLAHADAVIPTADSVNMTSEAAATGKPVYVFMPDGGSPKFNRFHSALGAHGATRQLPDRLAALEAWVYEPLDAGRTIAAEIERRWRIAHARFGH